MELETPILCPTRSFQGMPAPTMLAFCRAFSVMDRRFCYFQGGGCLGYAATRNWIFQVYKDKWPEAVARGNIRGVLVDDDMLLMSTYQQLAAVIRKADSECWNIIAPYKGTNGNYQLMDSNGDGLTPAAVGNLQHWDRVKAAGLGFYYGNIPLDYLFHEFPPEWRKGGPGEDFYFFKDNPSLEPRLAPLEFKHIKTALF